MTRALLVTLLLIMVLIATGCESKVEKKPITLTVNHPDERIFFDRVGIAFESKYPHIKLEVVDFEWKKDSSQQAPDLVFMRNTREYTASLNDGELLNLDYYYSEQKKAKMQLSDIPVSMLRWSEDGGLYGLAPAFSQHVIYFNKGLFDRFDVPYPHNQMSWQELLQLAQLFPLNNDNGERLYGFQTNYYENISFANFLRIGQTEGLSFIHPTTLKININTEKWKAIAEYVIQAFGSGKIYSDHDQNRETFAYSPIFTGQAAMEIASEATAYNFEIVKEQFQLENVDWGMVTVPVNPLNPEYSEYYQINEIFGISKSSSYKDEAWAFIEFITSDEEYYKRNKEQVLKYGIPSQLDFMKPIDHHDPSPLYLLKPAAVSNNPYDKVHFEIINAFKDFGQSLFTQVMEGTLTLDEAFEQMEKEGQVIVDLAKARLEDEG